ncbi:MAG: hypothetical protein H6908_06705 [Hyphomicrobiales bacterium]|nr:hypothetical protein [Rickettsiales bacterium]MCP5362301.1 hypothetical protein [Hyphomicrobiales bacterium]
MGHYDFVQSENQVKDGGITVVGKSIYLDLERSKEGGIISNRNEYDSYLKTIKDEVEQSVIAAGIPENHILMGDAYTRAYTKIINNDGKYHYNDLSKLTSVHIELLSGSDLSSMDIAIKLSDKFGLPVSYSNSRNEGLATIQAPLSAADRESLFMEGFRTSLNKDGNLSPLDNAAINALKSILEKEGDGTTLTNREFSENGLDTRTNFNHLTFARDFLETKQMESRHKNR